MPTSLWIAACIVSFALGTLIAYADSHYSLRRMRLPSEPRPRGLQTPNQDLLADVWREAA